MSKHLVNEHSKDFEHYKCEEKLKGGQHRGRHVTLQEVAEGPPQLHHGDLWLQRLLQKGDPA